MKKTIVLSCILTSLMLLMSCNNKTSSSKKVCLITMDQMDQHWVKVDKGAKDAAAELGDIDYFWLAPDVKDDNKQIESVNNAVVAGAKVILVAANGPDAITAALKDATNNGVKIIYVDSKADYPGEQFLATDNRMGGHSVGESLKAELTKKGITKGKIGIIGVNAATQSVVLREEGFRSVFADTDFEILETQYCQGDAALAKDMAANFISQGCIALFGSNEGSTVGIGNAVAESNGTVIGCGSDASDMNLSLIKNGHLFCVMGQRPYDMGYKGMKSASLLLQGSSLSPDYVDTGVEIITKNDL